MSSKDKYMRMPSVFSKSEFDKLNDSVRTEESQVSEAKHFEHGKIGGNQAMESNEVTIKKKSAGLKTGYNLCIFTTVMIVLLSIIVIINDATKGVPIDRTHDNV